MITIYVKSLFSKLVFINWVIFYDPKYTYYDLQNLKYWIHFPNKNDNPKPTTVNRMKNPNNFEKINKKYKHMRLYVHQTFIQQQNKYITKISKYRFLIIKYEHKNK